MYTAFALIVVCEKEDVENNILRCEGFASWISLILDHHEYKFACWCNSWFILDFLVILKLFPCRN